MNIAGPTATTPETGTADRNRGPSARVRHAVMTATKDLLDESGFANLTVDGIAERSGVSKATVYRWWSNRADVAMDALLDERGTEGWFTEGGRAIDRLRQQLLNATEFLRGPNGRIVAGVLGDAQRDDQIAAAFRRRFLTPLFELTGRLITQAVAEGDLRDDLDPDTVVDMLTGPAYFRLLVTGEPMSPAAMERLIEAAMTGARPATMP